MPTNPQLTANPAQQFSGPRYPNSTAQFRPREQRRFPDPDLVSSLRYVQGATAASCLYDPPASALELCPAEQRRVVTVELHPDLHCEVDRLIDLMAEGPRGIEELIELLLWNWSARPQFALCPDRHLRAYDPADHGQEA